MRYDMVFVMCFIMFASALINFSRSSNLFIMIVSIELMLNSLNIILARLAVISKAEDIIFWIITIITIAAAEVSVGLAILIVSSKKLKKTDVGLITSIREIFK
ncbi:MAG: NADH-quinone oxidoreductase subunit K [Elusimicrobiales bacterium]